LVSKNSGSYPNWGVYLSGSGGSGKLFAEYRINASVSCSVSSSTTFVTGSNYFVDVIFGISLNRILFSSRGEITEIGGANGSGTLNTTASLYLGNTSPSSNYPFSGSFFNNKIYSTAISGYENFRVIAPRIQSNILYKPTKGLALVVGGGGGGGNSGIGGGGGAGGFVISSIDLTTNTTYPVFVGNGGAAESNGQTSSLSTIIAYGGGGGGGYSGEFGQNGASGGGGGGQKGGDFIS
jgi:hypothetical protein